MEVREGSRGKGHCKGGPAGDRGPVAPLEALASRAVASGLCCTRCWGRPPSASLGLLSRIRGLPGHSQRQPAIWRARLRCGVSAAVLGSSWRGPGASLQEASGNAGPVPQFLWGEDGEYVVVVTTACTPGARGPWSPSPQVRRPLPGFHFLLLSVEFSGHQQLV